MTPLDCILKNILSCFKLAEFPNDDIRRPLHYPIKRPHYAHAVLSILINLYYARGLFTDNNTRALERYRETESVV